MAKSKRRNPDHAHKDQRPSPNNEQIAAQLEALLTPAITAQACLLSAVGTQGKDSELAVDGGSCVDSPVATSAECARIDPDAGERKFTVVPSRASVSASTVPEIS